MPEWKVHHPGVETMTVAVMGCVVNGPGESKAANIGISLPGTGESPNCPVYVDGEHVTTLRGTYEELARAFQSLVDEYVARRYPTPETAALVANIVCALFCCGIGLAWLPGVILSVFALNKSTAPETARKLTIGAWVCFWLNIVLTVVALMLLWVFGSRPTGTY